MAKKAAFNAFNRAMAEGATADDLIAGAERYRAHCIAEETPLRFIAHASTFCNQGRWEDQYDPPAAPAPVPEYEAKWRMRAQAWRERNFWTETWGPKPGEPGCQCPPQFLITLSGALRRPAEEATTGQGTLKVAG